MENLALIDSFSEFKDDSLIVLMAILEDVFRNALKNSSDDNFDIIINPERRYGNLEKRIIVADEDLDFENEEITLTEARKISH
jgi:N utilization substance protein A